MINYPSVYLHLSSMVRSYYFSIHRFKSTPNHPFIFKSISIIHSNLTPIHPSIHPFKFYPHHHPINSNLPPSIHSIHHSNLPPSFHPFNPFNLHNPSHPSIHSNLPPSIHPSIHSNLPPSTHSIHPFKICPHPSITPFIQIYHCTVFSSHPSSTIHSSISIYPSIHCEMPCSFILSISLSVNGCRCRGNVKKNSRIHTHTEVTTDRNV